MSTLAERLAAAPPAERTRRGPLGACEIYGPGDVDAYSALRSRLNAGETWKDVQKVLDELLDIEKPIHNDKFRYHWSGKCGHWDGITLP